MPEPADSDAGDAAARARPAQHAPAPGDPRARSRAASDRAPVRRRGPRPRRRRRCPSSAAARSTRRSPSSTELGLLAAFGTPEPVRYETNADAHDTSAAASACASTTSTARGAPTRQGLAGSPWSAVETRRRGHLRRLRPTTNAACEGARARAAPGRCPIRCRRGLACLRDRGPARRRCCSPRARRPRPRWPSRTTAKRGAASWPAGRRGGQAARGHLATRTA